MPEPSTTGAGLLGIKYSALIAAFLGAIVSLILRDPMTKPQMALAVLAGFSGGIYLGPTVGVLLSHLPALLGHPEIVLPEMYEAGVFLSGLTMMNAIPAWVRLMALLGRTGSAPNPPRAQRPGQP